MNSAPKIISSFIDFLINQKNRPSKATVKNYKADINQFVRWYETKFHEDFDPVNISHLTLSEYKIDRVESKNNQSVPTISLRTFERHLSSLRKLFNFLKLDGYIDSSPFEQMNVSAEALVKSDPFRIKDFKDNLYVYNASKLTIKNYVIDVKQFLNWAEEVTGVKEAWDMADKDVLQKIDNGLVEEYKNRLINQNFSPLTVNRKLSSLRKYIAWATEEGFLGKNLESKILNLAKPSVAKMQMPTVAHEPSSTKYESPNSKYSSFAPIRLLQKIGKAGNIVFDNLITSPIASLTEKVQYINWKRKGKPVFATAKNLESRIKNSAELPNTKYQILNTKNISNIKKVSYAPLSVSIVNFPWHKKALHHIRYTRPNWYKKYHSYTITHYFHFAILIIFMSALGFGMYRAFFIAPQEQTKALAALPTAPPRILSFQGRLTDNNDNPIDSLTPLRFTIYNDPTASGAALLWQEINTVDPDSDGIFSIYLGRDTSIPSTLFTENASLYLGVTVQTTPELEPRQQLATVAYAANAETLQGLLPITGVGAGQSNVVLALDSSGNLSIGGSATPTFQATGGKFTLSGNVLALTTTAGTNADVQIVPDGLGKIDVQKPLQNTSNSNNIATAVGAVEIDDLLAVLATSSGQSAFTVNQNSTGPIISASASGVAKFTVGNDGTVTSGNLLSLSANTYDIGSTGNYWNNLYVNNIYSGGSLLANLWQRTLGSVAPTNITDALNIGSTASTSAYFHVPGTNNQNAWFNLGTGNIGIGTTSPAEKFNIYGSGGQRLWIQNTGNTVNDIAAVKFTSANASYGWFVRGNEDLVHLYDYNDTRERLTINGSGNLGIGTTVPLATLDVAGNATVSGNLTLAGGARGISGTAMNTLTIGGSATGNIIVDSGSGVVKFSDYTTNGGLLYTDTTGTLTQLATGTTAQCLLANTGAAPSWGACGLSTDLYWNQTSGALFPNNSTVDFFIGGQATNSAKFSVLNINSGTPTASVSATATGNGLSLGGDAVIQSLRNNTLTIGGNTTGNIILSPRNGSGYVGIGTTSPGTSLDVYGGTAPAARFSSNTDVILMRFTNSSIWKNFDFKMDQNANLYAPSGNLGIGTANPISKLQVTGALSNAITAVDQYGSGDIFVASKSGAAKFVINNGGNVGIGTVSPTSNLQIGTLTSASTATPVTLSMGGTYSNTAGANMKLKVYDDGTYLSGLGASLSQFEFINSDTSVDFGFFAGGNQLIEIKGTGNVGIGTNDPEDLLMVAKASSGGTGGRVIIANTNASDVVGNASELQFHTSAGATNATPNGYIKAMANDTLGSADLRFGLYDNSLDLHDVLTLKSNGNVGIGTTSPSQKLTLQDGDFLMTDSGGNSQFRLEYTGSGNNDVYLTATRGYSSALILGGAAEDDDGLTVRGNGGVSSGQSVGIGTINPVSKFDIQGGKAGKALVNLNYTGTDQNILTASLSGTTKFNLTKDGALYGASFYDIDNSSYFLDPAATGNSLVTVGSIGIGGTAPTSTALYINKNTLGNAAFIINQLSSDSNADLIAASVSGAMQFRVKNNGDVYVGSGGAGKITAGTYDPLYTIDGDKYSTYAPSMVGVKEEVTGKAELSYNPEKQAYAHTINLASQPEASDLWLFSRVVDPNVALTTVLLTPDSSAKVWYSKDINLRSITFYSDSPTSLSYRLTAPRFDHENWSNISSETDPNITGLIVPEAEELINEKLETALNSGSPIYTEFTIAKALDSLGNPIYSLVDGFGNAIKKTENISNLVAANIKAGVINASEITVENITIGGKTIQEYIAISVDNILNSNYKLQNTDIVSPIASIDRVKTNVISPLASDSSIEVALGHNQLSIVNNKSGSVVASIDSNGNASFAGTLVSNNLTTNDASITGTLRADRIIANNIDGLEDRLSSLSSELNSTYEIPDSIAYADISSMSGQFIYVDDLKSRIATFTQGLMSFGPTSLSDTSIAGQLAIGGNLILADGSINVLGADLEIQPLRQGGISFLSGLVKIDEKGNLTVEGNANFAKDVTVKGKLAAGVISPLSNQDLTFVNSSNSAILGINQAGDVVASGSGTFGKLNLSLIAPAYALSDNEIIATGSAGVATISAKQKQLTINNNLVTDKSLIYITPIGPSNGQAPYLLRQVPSESFTIGIDQFTTKPIPFNWLIIN